MEDAALHPILDHVVAALDLAQEAPAYAADDLLALDEALDAIADDAEALAVFGGLASWAALLHEQGLLEARDALVPVIHRWVGRRAGLAPDPTGLPAEDGVERAQGGWADFAGAARRVEADAAPGVGWLTLRVSEAETQGAALRRRQRR